MGIVRMGVPEDIALHIRDTYNINNFIETGTFMGGTCIWASSHFQQVHTVEFSRDIYNETKNKFQYVKNINFVFGDSREFLRNLITSGIDSSLFWLDAHWCSMGSYGENDQCPLIEELTIINSTNADHFIMIDDARLFLAPPPRPNDMKYYPNIHQIMSCLDNQFLSVYEDVIFLIPEVHRESFNDFMQLKITRDWQKRDEEIKIREQKTQQSKLKKTLCVFKDVLRIWDIR